LLVPAIRAGIRDDADHGAPGRREAVELDRVQFDALAKGSSLAVGAANASLTTQQRRFVVILIVEQAAAEKRNSEQVKILGVTLDPSTGRWLLERLVLETDWNEVRIVIQGKDSRLRPQLP